MVPSAKGTPTMIGKEKGYSIKPIVAALLFCLNFTALGCATSSSTGASFTRLSNGQFTLGKTIKSEIQAIIGKPEGESRIIENGKTINVIHYSYATRASTNLLLVRIQSFYFYENTLVGHLYSSNFEQDATDFDDAQVSSIQKGSTKIEEVFEKLGTPSGEGVYPLTGAEDERKVMYFYPKKQADATIYTKQVVVFYKSNGIVSDIVFSESLPAQN